MQTQQLPHFPMKSQRRSPDANADFNCVPACVAAALQYVTSRDFEPNQVKDAVYGPGYVGGTAASAFSTYAALQGAHLFPISSTSGVGLVQQARQQLLAERPVIATEPDPYAPASNGWTHVICFYKWDAMTLTAMDPWTGADITRSDQEWATLLLDGEIWSMESLRSIPAGWQDTGRVLIAPNGISVVLGFRDHITSPAVKWDAANWPVAKENGRDPAADSLPTLGRGTWQPFKRAILIWTPTGGVEEMEIGPELVAARGIIATLQAQDSKPAVNVAEINASAKLIEETAQHIMTTLAQHTP